MPTYALLGATGATGSAVLRSLLSAAPSGLQLHILVRNKAKLLALFPRLLDANASFATRVFVGTADDATAMQRCLAGADAVFVCIASNVSRPGDRLFRDTARAVVDALLALRGDGSSSARPALLPSLPPPPTVLVLRAGHLNPVFTPETPWLVRRGLWFALGPLYGDIVAAAAFYEAQARANPGLFDVVFLDPPAIHDPDAVAPPTGYELVLERRAISANLSYADLGAAFVEVAGRRAEFVGKGIAVSATGEVHLTWEVNMATLWMSTKCRVLSWVGIKI